MTILSKVSPANFRAKPLSIRFRPQLYTPQNNWAVRRFCTEQSKENGSGGEKQQNWETFGLHSRFFSNTWRNFAYVFGAGLAAALFAGTIGADYFTLDGVISEAENVEEWRTSQFAMLKLWMFTLLAPKTIAKNDRFLDLMQRGAASPVESVQSRCLSILNVLLRKGISIERLTGEVPMEIFFTNLANDRKTGTLQNAAETLSYISRDPVTSKNLMNGKALQVIEKLASNSDSSVSENATRSLMNLAQFSPKSPLLKATVPTLVDVLQSRKSGRSNIFANNALYYLEPTNNGELDVHKPTNIKTYSDVQVSHFGVILMSVPLYGMYRAKFRGVNSMNYLKYRVGPAYVASMALYGYFQGMEKINMSMYSSVAGYAAGLWVAGAVPFVTVPTLFSVITSRL